MIAGACQPGATAGPAQPGATAQSGGSGSGAGKPEANVIKGRVATEAGTPIAGARLRIVGYTGGANLGQEIETVESDDRGAYRFPVPRGLYEVLGTAPIEFDGQTYVFDLEPADADCSQQMSDQGIVKDFVLRLTGISPCKEAANPQNHAEYHGAAVQLFGRLAGSYDTTAVIRYTLEPMGPLADGSTGRTLTFDRTIGALQTSAGPIESTWILHDIPLARYRVSAVLNGANGEVPLMVAVDDAAPAASGELAFPARLVVGTPDVGFRIPNLTIYDDLEAG